MAVTKKWKIWGREGHRQKLSFGESIHWDFSTAGKTRIIEVDAADKTGTNEYAIVTITRESAEECERELESQLNDGVFEDSRYGKIEEITEDDLKQEQAERVKKLVKKYGTQNELSENFGIPRRTVSDWCRGLRRCPGYVLLMMERISRYEDEAKERARQPVRAAAAPVKPPEETHDGEKLLYIVKSRKNAASDEWDEGYCWDINEARELARASKEHDASPYEYWIEGYYVADDYPAKAQAAYDRLSDDLSEEICWPDPDFYEVIKK